MSNFFKCNGKPEVNLVQIFSYFYDDTDESPTNCAEWNFSLPLELAKEMKEKYKIPEHRKVKNNNDEEILNLNYHFIDIKYILSSYDENWKPDNRATNYHEDDYRIAVPKYNGTEDIFLNWAYDSADDGEIWEGYAGDVVEVVGEDCPHDYDHESAWPNIEITGKDKEELLNVLHPIMEKILDGDESIREKLYIYGI